ncbi:MAG: hypothetical protein A2Y58_06050 [Chloroflexi bacterium RBG_13_51_52]|nr:MAG: hypothetical protein A2Y58_06050 [Chloroflexi bacterium RBG_13_51_52]
MTTPRHIIKNQVLELVLPSPATAHRVQDTVSRIYRESVVPVIESCCNEVGSPNVVHRFDSLCIDVGSILLGELETELPARTESRLMDLLKAETGCMESEDISAGICVKGFHAIPEHVSRLKLFEYFIDTGTLPWWADKMDSGEIEGNLKRLVAESPDDLADIVIRLVSDAAKLKRLVYQFPNRVLLSVAGAILRKFHPVFRRFLPAFIEAFLLADVGVKYSRSESRLAFWSEVFPFIVGTPQEQSDLIRFSGELLIRLSRRFGVAYKELTWAVRQAAEKFGENGLHISKVLATLVSDNSFNRQVQGDMLPELQAAAQSPEGLSNKVKNTIQTREQQELIRKLEFLLAKTRKKLRARWNNQEDGLKETMDSLERAIKSFLKLIKAGDFIARPAKQSVRKSESPITENNRVPATPKRVARESTAKHSLLVNQHLQKLENITKILSRNGDSSEYKVWFEELIKGLRSVERRILPAENIKILERLEVLVHNLTQKKNFTKSEKHSVKNKIKGESLATPVEISGVMPEDGSLSRNLKSSGNELLIKNSVSNSKIYPEKNELQKKYSTVPGRMIGTSAESENLLRRAESIIAALQQDINSNYPYIRQEKTTSNNRRTKSRKTLLPGDRRKTELYTKYEEILGLLEQFISLPYLEKEVASRLESVIRAVFEKEILSETKNQIRELQHELNAALRLAHQNIRMKKAVKVRSQESEKAIPDYTPTMKQSTRKNSKKQAKPLEKNLIDADLPNSERRAEFTKVNKGVAIKGMGARVKTTNNLTDSDLHRTELEKNIQGSNKYKVTTIKKRKYQPEHQSDSSKKYMLNDMISGVPANSAMKSIPRAAGDFEGETQGITSHEVEKVGGFIKAMYHSNIGTRDVERRYSISSRNESVDDSKEIYIQNTGLVILWPFLNRFFESVNLVKEGFFVNSEASERAVHLLQYIVDGSLEAPEHELPLNKVLCGRSLAEPVARDFEISKKESLESDNLIQSVIQNWPALGNISTEGFRVAFLQRRGLLILRNGDWLVQVERQTHDILLDKLDWTINVIRLPWLDNIIFTEW